MPCHSTELSIPARFSRLAELMTFIRQQALGFGFSADETMRLELVLEELASNSITHGYGKECDLPISVALRSHAEGLTLIYCDQAAGFNLAEMAASTPADDQIGGLGINLILGIARNIRYQRKANSNITELDF